MPSCLPKSMVLTVAVSLAAAFAASAQSDSGNSSDMEAAGIVASQIRSQGYKCDDPHTAKRDPNASSPDEAVWILACNNATYRVKLVPDQAAEVEQVD